MPELKERVRSLFESRAQAYGLDIAKTNNGEDYDANETQHFWIGYCWALGLA